MSTIGLHPGKITTLSWACLLGLSGLVGLASGVEPLLAAIATVGLIFPSLPALFPVLDRFFVAPLRVLAWTLAAVVATAATGAGVSPLVLLFAIGPLFCLVNDQRRLAVETAAFAILGYLAVAILGGLWPSLLPSPQPGLYVGALTFSTLLQAVLLGALAFVPISPATPLADQGTDHLVETAPVDRSGHTLPRLPDTLGLALISVTEQGRIRAIDGSPPWLADVSVGQIADLALVRLGIDPKSKLVRQGGRGHVRLADGTSAELHVRHGQAGSVFALAEADGVGDENEAVPVSVREAVAARTAFFASLGHDLKTPLNAIIGFADMMRAGVRGPVPEAYADYVEIIHESGNDLLLIVEDILDLAKADADRLTLDVEPVDLVASATSVVRQLDAQAMRADVRLERVGVDEAWAEADARAVRQIWQNLISNAIKYSPNDGTVTVSVTAAADRYQIAVEDRGVGMNEADLARLAEPFVQGTNSAGRVGTGLGLAVVKQYADLLGGQVRIETAPGEGTRVEVDLKAADARLLGRFDSAAQ